MPKPKYEEMSIAEYNELLMKDAEMMLQEALKHISAARKCVTAANRDFDILADKFEQMRLEL